MFSHRELLGNFVTRDLTSRYRETFIGFFWNVIKPLVMLAVYTFLFSVIFKVKFGTTGTTGSFALYLFCGMVPWIAFADSVDRASGIIMTHTNLVKKTVFPLEILPFYPVVSNVVTECIGLGILLVAVLVSFRHFTVHLLFLPLLLLLQVLFTLGFAFFLASFCVFFRDVMHVVSVMMTVWMFMTPIMYPETLIPERMRFAVWINPMALLVSMFRNVVLEGTTPAVWKLVLFSVWALLLCGAGIFFFRKTKWEFADVL